MIRRRTKSFFGYKPMKAKPGAARFAPSSSISNIELPPAVDLRPFMTAVEDQGDTNSCTANAVAGAYEYWLRRQTSQTVDISRLFVYYNARWRDGSQDEDDGAGIQACIQGLVDFGVCIEKEWPFQNKLVTRKPNTKAYSAASPYRVKDMRSMPLELEAWQRSLAQGLPIVFGCATFESFDDCTDRGGVVAMPTRKDVAREDHRLHAMCCDGLAASCSWCRQPGRPGATPIPTGKRCSSFATRGAKSGATRVIAICPMITS